jgi:hypothetical protein
VVSPGSFSSLPKNFGLTEYSRAIARDPTLFPDPEAFNPLRWVEPSYPTYKEPLTEYPTIINITQFGYGRRVCQGQTVADEDLLIGIGSIAWLFTIGRNSEDAEIPPAEPAVVADPEKVESLSIGINEKASVSNEELNTGIEPKSPTMEDVILSKFDYPGSYPTLVQESEKKAVEKPKVEKKDDTPKIDPTLDFTTLLIAKPLPFKFQLKPRNSERATKARDLFNEGVQRGDYKSSREFWGENQGKGKPLGWGKV